jgi:glycopeptide antibiotics resistance protein
VVLFLPLGLALGLVPPDRGWRRSAIALGLLSPFIVEGTQLLVRTLGRGCEAADIVDNLTGMVLGLVLGALCRLALASRTDGTGPA